MSEPEVILQNWKTKLLEALDGNGQIIIDIIPEVAKIIGQQHPVETLSKTEKSKSIS
ncbi:MAG UNVERIFIED_CONTAM: hypothetical protein LVR29_21470 [Microcystis novacekii LVE1205-3]